MFAKHNTHDVISVECILKRKQVFVSMFVKISMYLLKFLRARFSYLVRCAYRFNIIIITVLQDNDRFPMRCLPSLQFSCNCDTARMRISSAESPHIP